MNLNGMREVFKDALPIIKKFAPTIGAAIGGPVGVATGYILPLLATAFDSNTSDLKHIADTIINDPLAADKLGALEHEHCDFLCSMVGTMDRLMSVEINVKLNWNDGK
jgi:hypothetical protein